MSLRQVQATRQRQAFSVRPQPATSAVESSNAQAERLSRTAQDAKTCAPGRGGAGLTQTVLLPIIDHCASGRERLFHAVLCQS